MKEDLACLAISSVICLSAQAQWVRWEPAVGGNGHWYKAVPNTNGITPRLATTLAQKNWGYLATITSAEENTFVFSLVNSPVFFNSGNGSGPALGGRQHEGSVEPAGGWYWANGEPWDYTNWSQDSPNNGGGAYQEDSLEFYSGTANMPAPTWNDQPFDDANCGGYVVERDDDPNGPVFAVTLTSLTLEKSQADGSWLNAPGGIWSSNLADPLAQLGVRQNGVFLNTPGNGLDIGEISIDLVPGLNTFELFGTSPYRNNDAYYGLALFFDHTAVHPQMAVYNLNGSMGLFSITPTGTTISGSANGGWFPDIAPGSATYVTADGSIVQLVEFHVRDAATNADVIGWGNIAPDGHPDVFAVLKLKYIPRPIVQIYTAVEICWNSVTNQMYQVQWASTLDSNTWFNLGPPVPGMACESSVFDSIRLSSQRFYRVQLLQ